MTLNSCEHRGNTVDRPDTEMKIGKLSSQKPKNPLRFEKIVPVIVETKHAGGRRDRNNLHMMCFILQENAKVVAVDHSETIF